MFSGNLIFCRVCHLKRIAGEAVSSAGFPKLP